ncbi:hypothetical protein CHI08_24965 [Peribacillus simplex]|nr:hypothetical protein CHI08_24965 [Peribacillus simplex]
MIEYYVSSDGNHRTLWVKLVGALELEYTPISYNLIKNENYKRVQSNLSDYMKFVRVVTCNKKGGILRIRLASFLKARDQAPGPTRCNILNG